MKTKLKKDVLLGMQLVAIPLLSFLMMACKGQTATGNAGPQEYAVETLEAGSAQLKRSFPATIRGKQDVEIRPNVSGFITRMCVDEGAVVRAGQTLFIIDQVPYKAALEVAEANVNVAKANVETAELTAQNKRELQRKNIISEYDLQMAENTLASQKAVLAQAEAQLINARNNLSYTEVKSPSNGVIGTIPYRVGSLVNPSMATPMTTVSDISEMYVYFSMNEKQLLEMMRSSATLKEAMDQMPAIELQLVDNTIYPQMGKVDVVSGVIDPSTGAASMRAVFPNKATLLRSGGSGKVLIPYEFEDVVMVPQNATYEIQDKKYVYVLDTGNVVKSTQIEVYPLDDGKDYIVTSGLQVGDRVVIEGVAKLRNGMAVKPVEAAAVVAPKAKEE